MKLHLQPVDEVLGGLVVGVEDQALVAEAHQLDVLHLKEEATTGRPDRVLKKPKQRKRKKVSHLGRREGWRALLVAKSVDLSNIRKSLGKSDPVFDLRLLKTTLRIFLHLFQLAEMEGIAWLEFRPLLLLEHCLRGGANKV